MPHTVSASGAQWAHTLAQCTSRMNGKLRVAITCPQNRSTKHFSGTLWSNICVQPKSIVRQTPFMAIKLRKNAEKSYEACSLMSTSFQPTSNFEFIADIGLCGMCSLSAPLWSALFTQTVQSFSVIELDSAIVSTDFGTEIHRNRFSILRVSCLQFSRFSDYSFIWNLNK